jgi:hypothetical protein
MSSWISIPAPQFYNVMIDSRGKVVLTHTAFFLPSRRNFKSRKKQILLFSELESGFSNALGCFQVMVLE